MVMVQSGCGPYPAAPTSHTQADHGGACGTLPRCNPPLGEKIPTSVMPANIDDFVPTEEEVERVVSRLRVHRLGGPYRMRAKHLQELLWEHSKREGSRESATTSAETDPEVRER